MCCFSTTFFYFLYRNEVALAKAVGWHSIPNFPYLNEQTIGAFIGLCFFLRMDRQTALPLSVEKRDFSWARGTNTTSVANPRRTNVVSDSSMGICARHPAVRVPALQGRNAIWLALVFAVLFLITPLVTPASAQNPASSWHAYHWQAPRYILNTVLGTHRLGAQNLTALSVCFFNRDYRPQQMPHQLEAFKIAEIARISQRQMSLDTPHRNRLRGPRRTLGATASLLPIRPQIPATSGPGPSATVESISDG